MPSTTLYLLRHAETTWNAERRIQGTLDAPLSERGARQVRALVDALRDVRLSALYSSPLQRAMETARPGVSAHPLAGRGAGGRRRAWGPSPEPGRVPGGETRGEVQRRAMRSVFEIAAGHAGETVAAVGHGGVNKTILLALLGAPLASYWRIRQHNACINVVEFDGDLTRIITLNETSHLRDDTWHPLA